MPILTIHVVEGAHPEAVCNTLLRKASELYAEVLYPNSVVDGMKRIRVFINTHKASLVAVGGIPVSDGAAFAPFYEFLVLAGRPLEERQRLLTGFSDLIADILEVDRSLIRGACYPISADDWAIAGVPASTLRAKEIQARS